MKTLSDIQKKEIKKCEKSASSKLNDSPASSKKNEDTDNSVPIFLHRTMISSSEPYIQRQPLDEEEEILTGAANTSLQRQELDEDEEPIMPKISVGSSNDKYEQEADRVADRVMQMPAKTVIREQGSGTSKIDGSIRRKPT